MRKIAVTLCLALLVAASPAVAQEWDAMMDHAREALDRTHADLAEAMVQLAEVDENDLRVFSERIVTELGERLDQVHNWSLELLEQLAREEREARERHAREEAEEHGESPEDPGMLGRTLRLIFETLHGSVSILTATRHFEAGANRHEREAAHVEAREQTEHGGEGAFEIRGEVMPLDEGDRVLLRFEGHLGREQSGEENKLNESKSESRVEGGDARFLGSVIMGVGESKRIFNSPSAEIHLTIEEG